MTWNPFDWTAGPFILLYLVLTVIVFFWGFSRRSSIGPASQFTHRLSLLELAYLAGGKVRLGDATLLCLTAGNGAVVASNGNVITVTDQTPLAALLGGPILLPFWPDMKRQQFQEAITPIVKRVEGRLEELGYFATGDQMRSFRRTVVPFVVVLLVFGMTKVVVGAERDHSVGLLMMLLLITTIAGVALARRPARTRAGDEVLQDYQAANARAARAPLEHELLIAVALSGVIVLSDTAYAPVYAASRTMSSGDSGGCGGGGGGGGCGGCS